MDKPPSGTVTFLFTDIEGSTRIAQEHPDSWESLRGRHHEILRSAIEVQNGYVFQIIGDAFCAAFHTASEALQAAVAVQQGLRTEDWKPVPVKVRIGVNSGAAQLKDMDGVSGGYIGYTTLARAQRVMSVGHGGQILLSNTSAELARGELPPGVILRDMGEHRLKGLLNLEHLWQVEAAGLVNEFPPLQSLNAIPNNLPAQLTSFVGREKEIAEVKQELSEHRLVTLVGSGGTGKTRLSLQVAADVLDGYPDGVWFVELASLTDPELVLQSILAVLSIGEQKGKTPLQTLETYLQQKKLLIILDNCEHLIDMCAKAAQAILKSSSMVSILASSRESLGVSGEVSWHVPSLSLPDPKNLPELHQLTQYESVRLFIDRVLLVAPRFALSPENAPAIAQICYRLDGIPLALELAAVRARSMSVEQIMTHLDDRFRLLTGGSRTALPRQQTLRAMIDWSYDLLTDSEKLLLRRLAVFMGGWTLEMAERVCTDDGLDAFEILDLLSRLVDKSLVAMEEVEGGARYRILETVRQYAREKLFESGEGVEVRDRHRDVFLALGEEHGLELEKGNPRDRFCILDAEQENIRAALMWSLDNKDAAGAMRFCNALDYYWTARNLYKEASDFCTEALALVEKDDGLCKTAGYALLLAEKAEHSTDVSLNLLTHPATLETLKKSAALFEELGFPPSAFRGFCMLAYVYGIQNDHAAEERTLLRLLEGSRAAGEDVGVAWALCNLAGIYEDRGDIPLSDQLDLEAREAYLKIGYQQAALWQTRNLAQKEFYRGNVLAARRDLELTARELHALDNIALMKIVLWDLAYIAFRQGQYDQAERYEQEIADSPRKTANLDEERLLYKIRKGIQAYFKGELETARRLYEVALVTLEEMRWDAFAGNTMINYGLVLLRSGQMEEALPYFARGAEKLGDVGRGGQTSNAWYGLAEYHRLTGDLPASIAHFQKALFLRNRYQGYINIPDIFDGLAKVVLQQGDLDRSARWFGFAESLRIRFGIALQPVDQPDREKNVRSLKARMPAADFSSAWEAGDRMNLEEAVAQALDGYVHGDANGDGK